MKRIFLFVAFPLFSCLLTAYSLCKIPFKAGVAKGQLNHDSINEASGLIYSIKHPGYLWTHNDSGDEARLFLLDTSGRYQGTAHLENVNAIDWEDIAMMEEGGESYLLIGDIGDNMGKREQVYIHKVPEPELPLGRNGIDTVTERQVITYTANYEDGPRDAEALFFDPIDRKLYIITKRELQARLYGATFPVENDRNLEFKYIASLPYTFITAADIRGDGKELLVKNIVNVYYWNREAEESMADMLRRQAVELPYEPEPQGEALAFDRAGEGYYTISERPLGLPAYLYFYKRVN